MPFIRSSRYKKSKKAKTMRRKPRFMRSLRYNPQPIFTETFKLGSDDPLRPYYQLDANAGGVLSVRISQMPQIAQYTALYTKYRILKAKFICIPQFNSESSDLNAAIYNGSTGLGNFGMARLVTAVNNSPQQINPLNEDNVLEDNGCVIHNGKPKLVLSCRPVPDLLDANNVAISSIGQYINFNTPVNPDVVHYGIRWWYTLPNLGASIQNMPFCVL